MSDSLTIGKLAKRTGVPPKTIRFYESEGVIRPPRRSEAGYRLYGEADVQRLRFVRQARLLGLDLAAVKRLLQQAFSLDCAAFAAELLQTIAQQRQAIEARIEELEALKSQLASLEEHVKHCCSGCPPAQLAAECSYCCVIFDKEGGDTDART